MRPFLLYCICSVLFTTQVNAQQTVSVLQQDSQQFLSCVDLAKSLNMKFEVVQEGRLATFCDTGASAVCIPVQLSEANHRIADDGSVFLLLANAKSLLPIVVSMKAGKAEVSRSSSAVGSGTLPANGYNSPWPKGRGFGVGQTVPDIPLVDMNGNEVRFANYLGKRYILYCWASW